MNSWWSSCWTFSVGFFILDGCKFPRTRDFWFPNSFWITAFYWRCNYSSHTYPKKVKTEHAKKRRNKWKGKAPELSYIIIYMSLTCHHAHNKTSPPLFFQKKHGVVFSQPRKPHSLWPSKSLTTHHDHLNGREKNIGATELRCFVSGSRSEPLNLKVWRFWSESDWVQPASWLNICTSRIGWFLPIFRGASSKSLWNHHL